MERQQRIYYAIGELAYAMAKADGVVRAVEREAMHQLVAEKLAQRNYNYDYSEIIFHLLSQQANDAETIYQRALNDLRQASNFLDEPLERELFEILLEIAKADSPVNASEQAMLERLREDLKALAI